MKKAWAIIVSAFVAILASLLGRRASSKKKTTPARPENEAADIAEQAVQESFEEQVDRIRTATTGDSPADDLADLGNARKR